MIAVSTTIPANKSLLSRLTDSTPVRTRPRDEFRLAVNPCLVPRWPKLMVQAADHSDASAKYKRLHLNDRQGRSSSLVCLGS